MFCAGGISGLFHALTGEHLPGGRLEAMAEGNALGKGPVVFEVHQSAIELIRRLSASALSPSVLFHKSAHIVRDKLSCNTPDLACLPPVQYRIP